MNNSRRDYPIAYAVVLVAGTPEDAPLEHYAHGLWPLGFGVEGSTRGRVVGVIVDSGTGRTEDEIRAAMTVHQLDSSEGCRVGIEDTLTNIVSREFWEVRVADGEA